MPRACYDDTTKAAAVALYREHGAAEAARQTGITAGTIRSWASRSGVATMRREETIAATETIRANADARRASLAEKMLLIAEQAADKELELLANADLRSVVGARTRAIHDHQLLTGAATARTETTGREAAVGSLDELAKRRAQAA